MSARRRALVTGGAGFIGTNLVSRLVEDGADVVILDDLSRTGVERNLAWLQLTYGRNLRVERADLCDRTALRRALIGATEVYHLAAQVAVTTSLDSPAEDFRVNAQGTFALLEELRYLRDVERAHSLPRSRRQAPTGDGRRRDVEYEEFGLVVEIDGRLGHQAWAERQRDGRRDRGAAVNGRLTIRAFWPDLVPTPCALAGDVAAILRTRGWTGQPSRCGATCSLREGSVPLWGA